MNKSIDDMVEASRKALQPEGILILGQYQSHCAIARALGVSVPGPGEFVSVKVTPAVGAGRRVAQIGRHFWKVAGPNDPIIAAPTLPKI